MKVTKSFEISKELVWQAYQEVRAKGGSAGVDHESIERFSKNLKDNLYRIWNRMSSGTYFPPAIKGVLIPKKAGKGHRLLGVPAVSDRIAQTVAKLVLEPMLDPIFDKDSYGYRPNKSAHDAIAVTRSRCWKYDWLVEFDIKGLFDNIDRGLLMKALKKHCSCKWILLYVERWLKAPIQHGDGTIVTRNQGTSQGGVVSPILSNLFMHYAFDAWVRREMPGIEFCRFADDGVVHCRSLRQAEYILRRIGQRLRQCGLEIHPDKSGVIYCKDKNRKGNFERTNFDFLGYTFKPRRCVDKQGIVHPNFLPAISRTSKKAIIQEMRSWHVQLKNDKSLLDLSNMFNPVIRGWYNYYGRFYPSAMNSVWKHLNWYLVQWARRKYKSFAKHKKRVWKYLGQVAQAEPNLFAHWKFGILPNGRSGGSRMS